MENDTYSALIVASVSDSTWWKQKDTSGRSLKWLVLRWMSFAFGSNLFELLYSRPLIWYPYCQYFQLFNLPFPVEEHKDTSGRSPMWLFRSSSTFRIMSILLLKQRPLKWYPCWQYFQLFDISFLVEEQMDTSGRSPRWFLLLRSSLTYRIRSILFLIQRPLKWYPY